MNWAVMDGTLAKWGPTVDHAVNGLVAVESAIATSYDIVFMDIDMPVMDGYEATQRIADALGAKRPRIFAVTANMQAKDHAQALGIPFDGYMVKPIDPKQLQAWLEETASISGSASRSETKQSNGSDSSSVLDVAVLDGLVAQIGPEIAKSMMDEFMNSAPGIGSNLHEAMRGGDAHGAAKAAHQLKSMAGYIGAKELQVTCMEIDEPDFAGLDKKSADGVHKQLTATLAAAQELMANGWPSD
jgi:two-component system sensor histidine kinase/response regulator